MIESPLLEALVDMTIPAVVVGLFALLSATVMHYMIRGLLWVMGD